MLLQGITGQKTNAITGIKRNTQLLNDNTLNQLASYNRLGKNSVVRNRDPLRRGGFLNLQNYSKKKRISNKLLKKMTQNSLLKHTQNYKFFQYELNMILRTLFLFKEFLGLGLSAIFIFVISISFYDSLIEKQFDIYFMIFVLQILLLVFHYVFFMVFRKHTTTMTIIYLIINSIFLVSYDLGLYIFLSQNKPIWTIFMMKIILLIQRVYQLYQKPSVDILQAVAKISLLIFLPSFLILFESDKEKLQQQIQVSYLFLLPETIQWILRNLVMDHASYKYFENKPLIQRIYFSDKAISTLQFKKRYKRFFNLNNQILQ